MTIYKRVPLFRAFSALLVFIAAGASLAMPSLAHGQMFFVRNDNNTGHGFISEYTTGGVLVTGTLVSSINASWSGAIALSGSNLFVGDGLFGSIEKYTTSGATVSTTLVTGLGVPTGIAISDDGRKLFVSDNSNGTVGEYDAGTGLPVGDTSTQGALVTGLTNPQKIVVSGSNLYVVDPDATGTNGAIRQYTVDAAAGTVTSSNSTLVTGLIEPTGIAVSGTNLFVTMGGTAGAIGVYSTSGATVNANLASVGKYPGSIAVSGSNLFFIGYVGNQVIGCTVSGISQTVLVTGLVASGGNVDGIAVVGTSAGNTTATAPVFGAPLTVNTAPTADTMVMGDFDGDGVPDMAVLGANTGNVEVHFGDGAGGFRATVANFTITSSNSSNRGMAAADLTGSGTSELVFATGTSVQIYQMQSNGSFAQTQGDGTTPWTPIDLTATGINATKVAVGNLTAAGSQDVLVSDADGSVGVVWIPNDGTGNFGTPAAFPASGCGTYARPLLVDVDGDGLPDVVLTGGTDNMADVLINNGNGTLAPAATYGNSSTPNFVPVAIAVADVDGDGNPDLLETGYVHNLVTFDNTYYLSVNINNGNGTFADGQSFGYNLNGGVNIGANEIEAADFTGAGNFGVVTPDIDTTSGSTGFLVTQWTQSGGTLTAARQDVFAGDGHSYSSLVIGYAKTSGTFVTFNNDPLADVILGSSAVTSGSSEFLLFRNIGDSTPTSGRDLNFQKATYDMSESGTLDVTVTRGVGSTGQILAPFTFGGTAVEGGTGSKTADYAITAPADQVVTFGTSDYSKTIHIVAASLKGMQPDKTILLTLLEPEGNTELGSGSTTIVTIHSTDPSALGNPGGLQVKPTNVVKPIPIGFGSDIKVAGRTGSDWDFSASQAFPADATNQSVEVQVSLAPPSQNQWTDFIALTPGKGTSWTGTNQFPPTSISEVYFRTVASANGFPDHDGPPTQPFAVIAGPDLTVALTGSSDSDADGFTTHENEVLAYNIVINNVSADAAATNAVLTVPVPKHTTFLSATDLGSYTETKDETGRTTAVNWRFTSIPSNGTKFETLLLTVDPSGGFSTNNASKGFGYIFAEKGYNLSSAEVKSAYNLPNPLGNGKYAAAFDTEILGPIKVHASSTNVGSSVDPGGLITYTLDCENDETTPLTGAIATDVIPAGTELATVYTFDGNGNAETTPLPNPGPLTNPAIIYARTAFKPTITGSSPAIFGLPTVASQLTPTQVVEVALLANIWKASAGTELDPGTKADVAKLAQLDPTAVTTLVNDGFITPARIVWTMGTILGHVGGQSNVAVVAFQVRVPYDAAPIVNGNPATIINGTFSSSKKPATYLQDRSSYDFIIPSNNTFASYGDAPQQVDTIINDVVPAGQPHLKINKTAQGPFQLNNPNFTGNGTTLYPGLGDVVTAVSGHGVNYELDYSNNDYNSSNAADVVLHDVIPQGMQLTGFFMQSVNGGTPATMFAGQFTFYDINGSIIPGINPDGSANMANVASMDIRLGDVSSITTVPENTYGEVTYTCVPTIGPTDQIKYTPKGEPEGFYGGPGLIHSFGGYEAAEGLSGAFQGFYISTADAPSDPVEGTPDDVLVKVKNPVSFNLHEGPQKAELVRGPLAGNNPKAQAADVEAYDFTYTQNGDLTASNAQINFNIPQGVTLLNEVVSGNLTQGGLPAPNGDFTAAFTGTNAGPAGLTQSGTTAQLTLGTLAGHTTGTVRVFFLVNNPLNPALLTNGFWPMNAMIVYGFTSSALVHDALGMHTLTTTVSGSSGAVAMDPTAVAPLGAPQLSIQRKASAAVQKGSQFTYTITIANSGDTDATNVRVGMQIPWGTQFVNTGNGTLGVLTSGTISTAVSPLANFNNFTTTPRTAFQVTNTGPGPDVVTWHFNSVPAHSTGRIDLIVQVFAGSGKVAGFADTLIEDNSVYITADNASTAFLSPNLLGIWVIGSAFDKTKPEAVHKFLANFGIPAADSDAVSADIAQTYLSSITESSHVQAIAALDDLHLTKSGVHIFALGHNQVLVMASATGAVSQITNGLSFPLPGNQSLIVASGAGNVISNDGGSIVASGAGNIVASGAGNIVASGAGNAISVGNMAGIGGTHDCAYLLDNAASIVASGAGNIVASGAGNLIAQDGGTFSLLSNQAGGGILSAISPGAIASGLVTVTGGSTFIKGDGVITGIGGAASLVAHAASNAISPDADGISVSSQGANMANAQGGSIVATGAGNIVASGAGNIVASGAGNIVASGAGNIVASGAGN